MMSQNNANLKTPLLPNYEELQSSFDSLNINSRKKSKKQMPLDMKCPHCSKTLGSPRAFHQHVHMV
jgi:hypothetical protein